MSWWSQAKTFVSETQAEMKKVTFPSKEEVMSTTIVVLVASVVFAVFLWASDLLIVQVYDGILEFFRS